MKPDSPYPGALLIRLSPGSETGCRGPRAAEVSGVLCWGSTSAQALGGHWASGPPTYPIEGSCRELSAPWPPPRGRGGGGEAPGSTSTLV